MTWLGSRSTKDRIRRLRDRQRRTRAKSKAISGPHLVYGVLTTEPNAMVVHANAMPVILTTDEAREVWMAGCRPSHPRALVQAAS